ncbi:Predicted membrane channel-forming protein YqfA, hemolysin III family, partial [Mycobacterium numidiamassiliense]
VTHHTAAAAQPESTGATAVIGELSDTRAQGAAPSLVKPRLRGWIHQYCAVVAAIAGTALVAVSWAEASKRAGHSTLTYALTVIAMFTVSAVYHRVDWKSATARQWMRRLDHAMIFLLIAGSYTPIARLGLSHTTAYVVMEIVWAGAAAGIALTLFWPTAPRWVGVPLYLLLGWVAVWFGKTIVHHAGWAPTILLVVGGVLYSVGAVFYALRWPDPWPKTFGYHEIFHACTAVAALCHYIAIWFVVFSG